MDKAKHVKNAEKLIKDLQKDLDDTENQDLKGFLRATIIRANVILKRVEKLPDPPPKTKAKDPDPEVSQIVDDLMDPQ